MNRYQDRYQIYFLDFLIFATALAVYGSPGRARTADLMINSHPLYRLSYRGIWRDIKWNKQKGQGK